jgi:hypothetical protein
MMSESIGAEAVIDGIGGDGSLPACLARVSGMVFTRLRFLSGRLFGACLEPGLRRFNRMRDRFAGDSIIFDAVLTRLARTRARPESATSEHVQDGIVQALLSWICMVGKSSIASR